MKLRQPSMKNRFWRLQKFKLVSNGNIPNTWKMPFFESVWWDLITSPTRFISPYPPKNDIKTIYIIFVMFTEFIASLPFEICALDMSLTGEKQSERFSSVHCFQNRTDKWAFHWSPVPSPPRFLNVLLNSGSLCGDEILLVDCNVYVMRGSRGGSGGPDPPWNFAKLNIADITGNAKN